MEFGFYGDMAIGVMWLRVAPL